MMQKIDVWYYPNPLTREGCRRKTILLPETPTVGQLKLSMGVACEPVKVFVDGAEVDSEDALVFRDGAIVSFHRDAEDATGGLAFFLLDAGLFAGYELAVASFIVSSATTIAVNMLVSAVFAPDMPDFSGGGNLGANVPNAYSVSNANNSARGYQPLPLLMGNVRMSPDLDSRPWSQFVADPENTRDQTSIGESSVRRTVRGINAQGYFDTGELAFAEYPQNGYSYFDSLTPWLQREDGTVKTANYVWLNSTSDPVVELTYDPDTQLYYSSTRQVWETFIEATTAVISSSITTSVPETTMELTQSFNFGLGDLQIEDIRLGQTKITQYRGVTTSYSTFEPDKTVIGADSAHPNPPYGPESWRLNAITVQGGELRQNSTVSDSGWVKRDFFGRDCEFIQVDIIGRLYYSGQNGPESAQCRFNVQYRPEGGSWIQVAELLFINSDAFPVRETKGWAVDLGYQYEVRVQKITNDTTDARLTQEFELSQVKFFRPEPAKPDNPFTQHPAQNRLAIAVRAGGQINGSINDVNAYCKSRCWVWTGGTSSPPTIPVGSPGWEWKNTESPAWWYLYYAMGGFRRSAPDPGSPLDGKGWCVGPEKADGPRMFGAGLRTSRIDLDSIAAWDKFCTFYNLRFNAVLRDQTNVGEALSRISRIGRGSPTWQVGRLGVVWEDPDAVEIAAFGSHSIIAGSLKISYIGQNSPDEIVASFTNPDDEWKDDEVRKTVPGVVLPNSEATINLFGCKYKDQAQREVNLLAARQFYQRRRVEFETAQEGLPIVRGDVIYLTCDMTDWAYSSRVGDGTSGSNLSLVRRIEPLPGTTFDVMVIYPDGSLMTGLAAMPATETHNLTLLNGWEPINFNDFPDAVPEDWVVYLSTTGEYGKRMRIVSVEPNDGRTVKITCADERKEMWAYEEGGTPDGIGDSGENLIAKVQNLSIERDSCTNEVFLRWELDNCRGAVVTVNYGGAGGSLDVLGESLSLGILPTGTSITAFASPLLDIQAVKIVTDSGVFVV